MRRKFSVFLSKQSPMVSVPELCPSCGGARTLKRHGTYTRTVSTTERGDVQVLIQRVLCRACRRSHALLYDFLVPYRKFTQSDLKASCEAYLRAPLAYLQAVQEPVLEVATVFTALESMLRNLPVVSMRIATMLFRRGFPVADFGRSTISPNSWKCRKEGKAELLNWAKRLCELAPDLFECASRAGLSLFAGRRGCELLRTHSSECALF